MIDPLYRSRSGAGAELGRQVYKRLRPPVVVVGVTPTGVEIAAGAAKALDVPFDVVVTAHVRMEGIGILGAVAEDANAVLDSAFQPRFGVMQALNEAIERARRVVKTDRVLFRGQRPLRTVAGVDVAVVDGHLTVPWKVLAATEAILEGHPRHVIIAAPVSTQSVQERLRARRVEFLCPTVLPDPGGHPRPFGDPDDPSAERLRSIIIAREAA